MSEPFRPPRMPRGRGQADKMKITPIIILVVGLLIIGLALACPTAPYIMFVQ